MSSRPNSYGGSLSLALPARRILVPTDWKSWKMAMAAPSPAMASTSSVKHCQWFAEGIPAIARRRLHDCHGGIQFSGRSHHGWKHRAHNRPHDPRRPIVGWVQTGPERGGTGEALRSPDPPEALFRASCETWRKPTGPPVPIPWSAS